VKIKQDGIACFPPAQTLARDAVEHRIVDRYPSAPTPGQAQWARQTHDAPDLPRQTGVRRRRPAFGKDSIKNARNLAPEAAFRSHELN
jgi:hypothetical protein